MDEVFGKRNSVDVKQITNSYNQNFGSTNGSNKPYETTNIDQIMSSQFDYNKVNQYMDSSKSNGEKDHFSFVNDLLKTKKN